MPDQITITITPEDQQRLGYKARTVGRSPRKFLEDLIHELAQTYPLPPARPTFADRKEQRIKQLAQTHSPSKIARHYGTDTEVIETILSHIPTKES